MDTSFRWALCFILQTDQVSDLREFIIKPNRWSARRGGQLLAIALMDLKMASLKLRKDASCRKNC